MEIAKRQKYRYENEDVRVFILRKLKDKEK